MEQRNSNRRPSTTIPSQHFWCFHSATPDWLSALGSHLWLVQWQGLSEWCNFQTGFLELHSGLDLPWNAISIKYRNKNSTTKLQRSAENETGFRVCNVTSINTSRASCLRSSSSRVSEFSSGAVSIPNCNSYTQIRQNVLHYVLNVSELWVLCMCVCVRR